ELFSTVAGRVVLKRKNLSGAAEGLPSSVRIDSIEARETICATIKRQESLELLARRKSPSPKRGAAYSCRPAQAQPLSGPDRQNRPISRRRYRPSSAPP